MALSILEDGVDVDREDVGVGSKELCVLRSVPTCAYAVVHAWDYRRYVLQSLPSSFKPARSERDELRYTQKKIEANFSNFSAWHTRTKLFGRLWPQMEAEEVEKERSQGQLRALSRHPPLTSSKNWSWCGKLCGRIQGISLLGCIIAGSSAPTQMNAFCAQSWTLYGS